MKLLLSISFIVFSSTVFAGGTLCELKYSQLDQVKGHEPTIYFIQGTLSNVSFVTMKLGNGEKITIKCNSKPKAGKVTKCLNYAFSGEYNKTIYTDDKSLEKRYKCSKKLMSSASDFI